MAITSTQFVLFEGQWEPEAPSGNADLVFLFGDRELLTELHTRNDIQKTFPHALICGCSTAGEISGRIVRERSVVVTTVRFEHTKLRQFTRFDLSKESSFTVGCDIQSALASPDLRHIFVLSEGLHINGTSLVEGLRRDLPPTVSVTGGLAGDGVHFGATVVCDGANCAQRGVVAIGFYGSHLQVGCGSCGGWDPFGPERIITGSNGSVLHELDGKNALDLYKAYLGPHAEQLPASALLFPLSLKIEGHLEPIVRTVLSVSDEQKTMTFAGDMPQGARARFMKANVDRLVDGSQHAATAASIPTLEHAEFALLISCVGRRLVLKQRVEDEVEAVATTLPLLQTIAGFYSYGEIAPFLRGASCELHNQTMTVTTFKEE